MAETVTIPRGRILWHARLQSHIYSRKNVMNSPDYLYTSPQIQQALYHGLSLIEGKEEDYYVELTKLRVKEPLKLLKMTSVKNQATYANFFGVKNYEPFGFHDTYILKGICKKLPQFDGYRAVWDQDQIALCAKAIRAKLERLDTYPTVIFSTESDVTFKMNAGKGTAYYKGLTKFARNLVRRVKTTEKQKAVLAKFRRVQALKEKAASGVPPMRIVKKMVRKYK